MKLNLHKLAKKTKLDKRSIYLRELIIECLQHEKRGHIGSSLSLVEMVRVLYDKIIKFDCKKINLESRDRFILSKGQRVNPHKENCQEKLVDHGTISFQFINV